jgi:hypothetical protein
LPDLVVPEYFLWDYVRSKEGLYETRPAKLVTSNGEFGSVFKDPYRNAPTCYVILSSATAGTY